MVKTWTFPQLFNADFTLMHWKNLIGGNTGLASSLLISLAISTALSFFATFFGFIVSKQIMSGKNPTRLLHLSYYPFLIAPVVFGCMLQFYFIRWGLTGTLLGVMLAQSLFILPYGVLMMSSFWTHSVKQTELQARTLGANQIQVNMTVLIPMAKPFLLLCFVQCFLISWFEYGITQFIGLGKVDTLTIRTMHFVNEANSHLAAVAALIMILPLMLILFLNKRLLIKRTVYD
jgi:putative spermidine/putrescine transport system permease protein